MAIWASGLNGLAAAVADELARGASTFTAIDSVESKDESVHGISGTLTARKDMITVDGLTANIPVIKGSASVGAGVVQVCGDAHFLYNANGNGGRVAVENFCSFLCSFEEGTLTRVNLGIDFLFSFSREIFDVAGNLNEELAYAGGVVLGVIVDDVTEKAEEDFDAVANEVVVGGAVDVLLGEGVFLGGIAIKDITFFAWVLAGEDVGDSLTHDALGIGGTSRRKGRREFIGRRILSF